MENNLNIDYQYQKELVSGCPNAYDVKKIKDIYIGKDKKGNDKYHKKEVTLKVPCRRCEWCIRQKEEEWTARLSNEMLTGKNALFVTLTYDNDHLPLLTKETIDEETGEIIEQGGNYIRQKDAFEYLEKGIKLVPTTNYKDVQNFIKLIRKDKEFKNSASYFRYFAVTEYGGRTQRPHAHLATFGLDEKYVKKHWKYADIIDTKPLGMPQCRYISRYMYKRILNTPEGAEKPKRGASNSLGMGSMLIKVWNESSLDGKEYPLMGYTNAKGELRKTSLPTYYKQKLYDEKKREQFAKNKKTEYKEKEEEILKGKSTVQRKRIKDQLMKMKAESLERDKAKKILKEKTKSNRI